jgi:hypothetical protein
MPSRLSTAVNETVPEPLTKSARLSGESEKAGTKRAGVAVCVGLPLSSKHGERVEFALFWPICASSPQPPANRKRRGLEVKMSGSPSQTKGILRQRDTGKLLIRNGLLKMPFALPLAVAKFQLAKRQNPSPRRTLLAELCTAFERSTPA